MTQDKEEQYVPLRVPEPKVKWEDPHVKTVYDIICCDAMPNNPEQHWDGFAARRIVDALPINRFKVTIAEYRESSGTSWVVQLVNENLPHDPLGGSRKSPGYLTPYMSKVKDQVEHEAQAWARFLGVPSPVECTCVMCEIPKRRKE